MNYVFIFVLGPQSLNLRVPNGPGAAGLRLLFQSVIRLWHMVKKVHLCMQRSAADGYYIDSDCMLISPGQSCLFVALS